MLKKCMMIAICVFFLTLLCACSGLDRTPNENKILTDYIAKRVGIEYANFSEMEIKRKQLNENDKKFIADIEITGEDEYAEYVCSSSVVYNYYDDEGWMLDEIVNEYLETKCHTGRSLSEIEKDIKTNYTTYLPGGLWVDDFKLENLLEENTQIVSFDCETCDKHLITSYDDVKMFFRYVNGDWVIEGVDKIPSNFKINLQGVCWESEKYGYLTIKDVSWDSKNITIEFNGEEYKGTLQKEYSETTFLESSVKYRLDRYIDLGIDYWWHEERYASGFYISNLTSNEKEVKVGLCGGARNSSMASFSLASSTPQAGVKEYY